MTQCWKCGDMDSLFQSKCDVPACGMKETKRTWVELTDEEIDFIDAEITKAGYCQMKFTRAIEAKLKAKNSL